MKKILWVLLGPMFLLTWGNAFADIVILKDGRQISGSVESAGSRSLLIKVGDDSQVISMDQVVSIEFNPLAAPAATPAAAIAATPPEAPASPAPVLNSAAATPAAAPEQPGITLPIGTEIAARTIDRIDSKKADKYKEYAASLDDPIVVNGVTIAPVNSNAFLRVTAIRNPKLKGKASLSTTLVAVIIDGRRVNLETEKVDSQGGSQSKRTAIGAGGGAAVGAGIGAGAGGGVGAAVGAGVGAAAGTLGAALTAKGVEIPPETRFTYKLAQPAIIDAPVNSK
jgi:hypothetical protein